MRSCLPQSATLSEYMTCVCGAHQHADELAHRTGSHCHESLQVKHEFHKSQLYSQSTVSCYIYALWPLYRVEKTRVGFILVIWGCCMKEVELNFLQNKFFWIRFCVLRQRALYSFWAL